MSWKNEVFKNFKLYAVTDIQNDSAGILEKIDQAYRGGADIIQLRSKKLSDNEFVRFGKKIKALAQHYQKLFFVNDRLDLALITEADGLHLGQEDIPLSEARKILKQSRQKLWLGKSTHSLKQALAAVKEGADYIGVGPIFTTPTKPHYKAVGLNLIRRVNQSVRIPFVTIGGINLNNINQVLEKGATRVAVVRAIFTAPHVYEATKKICEKIDNSQQ